MHHPSAIISPEATIGENVSIGAFSIIEAGVTIGDNTTIDPHVWVTGKTIIGKENLIGFGSHIGGLPQDHSFDPSTDSGTIIGDNNSIRENVTIHRSTKAGENTVIGNHNFLMVGTHLAHDVTLGDHNVIANNCMLAGHITVGNRTFLGGGAGFHQFINIGDYAISQGNAAISKDIPPYCMCHGQNKLAGLNIIGLRRSGFDAKQRENIKKAYDILFRRGLSINEAIKQCKELGEWTEAALKLIDACESPSRKGVLVR
ncbi:acyl-[acyl-carrier-protein]--UDP-N-acetylglucosamine O-acyltransferase [Rubritalea squalenifaciens DSM 18772]|uniref:Acyl-[acyl-carrier-protein]--UDP-N-acetylglucosamine O-acyltransferase n=1 Tax=Rubritalea squalenifaciens DSM 18772 TaxID=1123071 RepID=A0A1M6NAQ2_9BACT|nr:acyl-ACP--UDP-N-acetylglucosamine O-acyltransferase [Rubritalea squalenifaciens]SHJ92789.1 acyl-[acyl-carrier-protein]--UDP-N-acetylglucosamine O-acyltransferase [Rubritalea squalenifaciens DSM 18772]